MAGLEIYNTLSSKRETFTTQEAGVAKVYVCGPTVYDHAHLGHGRSCLVFDVLTRHLRATGYKVQYVRNITDIDDKIVRRAVEENRTPLEVANQYAAAYTEDMARLRNLAPDVEPRVSDHLPHIHALIQTLIDRGAAYAVEGNVWFKVRAFPNYGKLSHRKLEDMVQGASGRLADGEQSQKQSPEDFALWKCASPEEPGWPSPWGHGRPGWHIECSAMAIEHLGETMDLHGGGLDLVFPHHENEIAQSECATTKPYATHWMHNGFVEIDKEKMSKSLGNFFTLRALYERYDPEALRYFMLTTHYRAPLHFAVEDHNEKDPGNAKGAHPQTFPQLDEAEGRIEYLYETRQRLHNLPPKRISPNPANPEGHANATLLHFPERLRNALNDDLNTSVALSHLAAFLKATNEHLDQAKGKKGKVAGNLVDAMKAGFEYLGQTLGLAERQAEHVLAGVRTRKCTQLGIDPQWVQQQLDRRAAARANKDFATADAVRDELQTKHIEILDRPTGTDWKIHQG